MEKHRTKLILLTLGLVAACAPQPAAKDVERLAVANEMVDAWNKMDWDRAFDLFADDGVLHSVMGDPYVGKEVVSERLRAVVDGLERIELQIINMGIINDVVILERVDDFVYKGKHSRVPVVGVMEISEGKIDEWREYYDRASLMEALTVDEDPQSSLAARTARNEIMALTKKLSIDWNQGDMEAYLGAYQQEGGTSLLFGGTILASADEIRELFTSTWTTEEQMGDFETSEVTVRLIEPGLAIARGRFDHQFPTERVTGVFSHLWKQSDGTWKIVHEQTSRGTVE